MPDQPYPFEPQPPPNDPTTPPAGQFVTGPTTANPAPPDIDSLNPQGLLGYGCTVEYTWDLGLGYDPVAAPKRAVPIQFRRKHTGICFKVISVVATAVGRNPILPAPTTGQDNDVLVSMKATLFSPGKMPDGTQIKGVVLIMAFVMQMSPDPTVDNLDMGANPFDTTTADANVLMPSDYTTMLIEGSGVEGFTGGPINY